MDFFEIHPILEGGSLNYSVFLCAKSLKGFTLRFTNCKDFLRVYVMGADTLILILLEHGTRKWNGQEYKRQKSRDIMY